eukprot:Seg1679.8 transcript_id=Seg1679.8/GoldUCD/mRNA.D3Y31 product="Succinate-CoA ligase" protein_id=Seg1679.8/GoldUCD/D3Y31
MAAVAAAKRFALQTGRQANYGLLCKKQLGMVGVGQKRFLNLQEYQSKKLMARYGINIQRFEVAETVKEALDSAHYLIQGVKELVIKAQILAGGRGKGTFSSGMKGGVHLTEDPNDVEDMARGMLGYNLVTKQTPADGVPVNKIMVAQALDIARETYLAILMDRDSNGPVVVASPEGGMDIEEVAEKFPEKIFKERINIEEGLTNDQAISLATNLGFKGDLVGYAALQIKRLYNLFIGVDATQVEINPFGETPDGQVVCFDAKINFDDNAQFRQKYVFEMDDHSETDPREVQASKYNLNYIGMDGNIACLVNGAGLAMATMDIIKLHGGNPANFLDLGGGIREDGVYQAFKIITSDNRVKAILVNIFGGIVDCATIARGITKANRGLDLGMPIVVRLEGTNVTEARRILDSSGMLIETADDLEDAALKAVSSLR